MIDESIIDFLEKKHGDLDFKCLVSIMKESGIPFYNKRLREAIGLTSFTCIYVDLDKLTHKYNYDMLIYFVFLHEMCHFKRISKYGVKHFVTMLSDEDFNSFAEHLLYEEVLADRYASLMFKILNGTQYPKYLTQNLDDKNNRADYKSKSRELFGHVKNDENNYNKVIESFLV